jgi:hypothetical protein
MLPETLKTEMENRTLEKRESTKLGKSKPRAFSSKKITDTVGSANFSKKKKKFQEA